MLCLYLGSAETFLGDMNADDFIDCIAWCGRNISEFTPDYKNTQDFLETCDGLFKYLKGKMPFLMIRYLVLLLKYCCKKVK